MEPEELQGEVVEAGPIEAPATQESIEEAVAVPAVQAAEVALEPLSGSPGGGDVAEDLTPVLDVPVELAVEMGRATMTIRETLAIGTGSIITLNRLVGEPVDLFANGRLIARGEVIAIDEEYGLRVTEVLTQVAKAA
jgi:flagellar motor switch protein FliN/FliY